MGFDLIYIYLEKRHDMQPIKSPSDATCCEPRIAKQQMDRSVSSLAVGHVLS